MTRAGEPDEAGRRLAQRLVAAGKMLGCSVAVTDEDEWEDTAAGIRVGLGFFRARGYSDNEAVVLSIRDLWASVRFTRLAPARGFRRATLAGARPDLAPLLAVIERVQAEQELLSAMPGLAGQLRDATLRGIPAELRELPLETQWLGAILRLCVGADPGAVDAPVAEELGALLRRGASAGAALALVMRADHARTPVERLDRALALLAPPLLRLRERAGSGLTGESGDGDAGAELGVAPDIDLGGGAGAGDAADDADADRDAASAEAAATAPDTDPSREPDPSGERGDPASLPDPDSLTEAPAAAAPESLLDIPLPASQPRPLEHPAVRTGDPAARPRPDGAQERRIVELGGWAGEPPSGGLAAAQLSEYRSRTARFSPEIRRLRELWREVLHQHERERRALSRRAAPEGEQLHGERLAQTVTEVWAGVPHPSAFRQRLSRPRDAEALGEIDYLLVLDRSASMQGGAAEACADAALVMLESLAAVSRDIRRLETRTATRSGVTLRAGVIVFADRPVVVAPLGRIVSERTRAALTTSVRAASGQTDAAAAVEAAGAVLGVDASEWPEGLTVGQASTGDPAGVATVPGRVRRRNRAAPQRRRIVLFVGDGDTDDPGRLAAAVARLRGDGVEVHGIGIGSAPGMAVFAPDSDRIASVRELPNVLAARLAATLPVAPSRARSRSRARPPRVGQPGSDDTPRAHPDRSVPGY